ncbi:MAG: hypothetical protein GC155_08035 [Alphaproteobacteria bacterium]|nr:hypothetical protein [Alphaproteobacteria bacterium]
MSSKRKDLLFTLNHVRKAVRRGDAAAADRWQKLAVPQGRLGAMAPDIATSYQNLDLAERGRKEEVQARLRNLVRRIEADREARRQSVDAETACPEPADDRPATD